MKTLGSFHMGDYQMDDKENRLSGHCRIGNILVPNENYIKLESFLLPLFQKMSEEQERDNVKWTPSKMIARFGK
jgi:deoxyhypusine synthase